MNRRWYDHDPTLSMAVSLLQNASTSHQQLTAQHILGTLERSGLLEENGLTTEKISFIFPLLRRINFNTSAMELLEVLKRLPHSRQIEAALGVINYIYMLETGHKSDWMDATLEESFEEKVPAKSKGRKAKH